MVSVDKENKKDQEKDSKKNLDEFYMRRALSLAERGVGYTSPNPLVGCVIVKDNEIIGESWHKKFGEAHAEINALNDAFKRGKSVEGATVYVTLEPCCHYDKKTPPCAQRLIKEKVSRVVAAMADPNPKVFQNGLKILREARIDAGVGCLELEEKAKWLNRGFIKAQKFKTPWVSLKAACGLDGRMALLNGESKWITGVEARTKAHEMRAAHDAILVGVNTVLNDNPELTVRLAKGRNPLRVILDAHLRTPENSKIINAGDEPGRCVIFHGENLLSGDKNRDKNAANIRAEKLIKSGAELIYAGAENNNKINLNKVLKILLEEKGVLKLMVEGGPGVITSFISQKLADSLSLFVAPKIMGEGIGIGSGLFINSMENIINLKNIKSEQVGRDILIEGLF